MRFAQRWLADELHSSGKFRYGGRQGTGKGDICTTNRSSLLLSIYSVFDPRQLSLSSPRFAIKCLSFWSILVVDCASCENFRENDRVFANNEKSSFDCVQIHEPWDVVEFDCATIRKYLTMRLCWNARQILRLVHKWGKNIHKWFVVKYFYVKKSCIEIKIVVFWFIRSLNIEKLKKFFGIFKLVLLFKLSY